MARKAIVQKDTGLVLNVIEIEPEANWPIPEGCLLVDAPTSGGVGDTWDGTHFGDAINSVPSTKKRWGKKK